MKKIVMIFLVAGMMICFAFAPEETQIVKAGNTITLNFDPDGNVSLDVSPDHYNFSVIYANSSKKTLNTLFTIWNNGTIDNMSTTIQITTSPTNFTHSQEKAPYGVDMYNVKLIGGTADGKLIWVNETTTVILDNDTDTTTTATFGFVLQISGLTQNFSDDSLIMTLVGTAV